MMEESNGLKRDLKEGEAVILSTGATATARRSYRAGYTGDVEILLDGHEEKERASGLVLPDESSPPAPGDDVDDASASDDIGHNRAPSRKMED
ncbi:MAG: hypothetical protein WBE83_12785 [Candidatus Cybelea sp.]|jgi:hypothetical protein